MQTYLEQPRLPSDDKRWKIVEATARRHGREPHALIETLHTVQECFGYLDETALRFVAGSLRVPLSRVYGAATFYHFFTLKPKGKHTCVVCTGTACYIKGAAGAAGCGGEELGHPSRRDHAGRKALAAHRALPGVLRPGARRRCSTAPCSARWGRRTW